MSKVVWREARPLHDCTGTGKKTPGGAGTHTGHTGHTGARGHTDHTDQHRYSTVIIKCGVEMKTLPVNARRGSVDTG